MSLDLDLEAIYQRRFDPDLPFRQEMWRVLCRYFFQKYVPVHSSVLEIGAGYCEFINNIDAQTKIAIDLNPSMPRFANPDVTPIITSSTDLSAIEANSIDVVFTSNFFEHLTRSDISHTIREVARVLKRDGRFLILQPNFRFCYRDYWMFFDHITALDDRSLAEVLETNGFQVVSIIAQFLPYTTKGRLPNSIFLLKLYLRLPIVWRIFGAQAFVIAEPKHS
jgi:ubiquinone/menaquinone biosynthesis C-methylase UbiE